MTCVQTAEVADLFGLCDWIVKKRKDKSLSSNEFNQSERPRCAIEPRRDVAGKLIACARDG